MSEVKIRFLEESDFDSVLEIVSRGYQSRDRNSIEWSLGGSPIFCRELSAIAEIEGKPVGVWLSSVQELKIADGVYIPASSGLIVVHPDFRRRGIGTSLWRWRRKEVSLQEGTILGYGVSSQETRRVFWKRLSTAPMLPDRGLIYSKLLSVEPVRRAVRGLQDSKGLGQPGQPGAITVSFDLIGVPKFCLMISPRGLAFSDRDDPDMVVRSTVGIPGGFALVWSVITGRIRISGWRHILALFRCRRVLGQLAAAMKLQES